MSPPPPAPDFGFDVVRSRAEQSAAYHLSNGLSVDMVKADMAAQGFEGWEPDARTPAERAVDSQYGVQQHYAPTAYAFQVPQNPAQTPEGRIALVRELSAVAAGLKMTRDMGSSFCRSLAQEISDGDAAGMRDGKPMFPDEAASVLAARTARNEEGFARMFPDPARLAEAKAQITTLVDGLGITNAALKAAIKPGGVLASPQTLMALLSRARFLSSWQAARKA
jgi:hypothetical protein